jgi:plasmid stabilization system protein ParE
MTPVFHPEAEQEIAAALKMGEERGVGLGRGFLREIRRASDLLCDAPRIGEPLDDRHRRFPLRKFPFGLIYRVDGSVLRVIAVAHRRQRPGYWRTRG